MDFNEKIILSNDKLSIIRNNDGSITAHFDDLDLSFLHDGVV